MTINKIISEVNTKKIIFENPEGKPLTGYQLSAILLNTNYKHKVQSVVMNKEGIILRVDCLTKADA